MRVRFSKLVLPSWFASSAALQAAITPEQAAQLPPPANHQVSFSKEIKPIFEASCIKCHGRGKSKGGFRLDNRETFLKGGESGPAAVPGKSADSLLISLVQGLDPDSVMPKKGSRLTPDQIGLLRAWIDQDVPWDAGVSFGRLEPINLKPRLPQIPPGPPTANPIDRFLQPYFVEHRIKPPEPVSDRLFARRVYLDLIGLLPPPEELEASFATITEAPATLTAGANKSPNGSTRPSSPTCLTTASSPNSSTPLPSAKDSPKASSGAASSMPAKHLRCRPPRTFPRSSGA